MVLKITPKQRTKINALVRKTCCNCYKGNCLLMDDGEETKCVQLISRYGIYCNYFLNAVLPSEKELYEEIQKQNPDGVFLSNGPGNPKDVKPVLELVRKIRGNFPLFGICLGHQMIGLAYGAGTYKLKFGHRGGNHPVKNLKTGKIEITSQNHSYAVDYASLKNTDLEMTHINLLDHTVEGIACRKDHVFSVQYHPESAPGPQDSGYLFDQFIQMMEENKHGKAN